MGKTKDAGTKTPEEACRSSADTQLLSVISYILLLKLYCRHEKLIEVGSLVLLMEGFQLRPETCCQELQQIFCYIHVLLAKINAASLK